MSRYNPPTLNLAPPYPATHPYGFPDLLPQTFTLYELPNALISYREPRTVWTPGHEDRRLSQHIAHFFLDDYRFESVWTKTRKTLQRAARYAAVMTPDFSMYTDWPTICQMWNHYRKQWVGRHWQEHGIRVIPTVNWSTPDSYAWCFAGIPHQQIVALAVPDLRNRDTKRLFMAGYRQMLNRLKPSAVLVYGALPAILHDAHPKTTIQQYPPDWHRLKRLK